MDHRLLDKLTVLSSVDAFAELFSLYSLQVVEEQMWKNIYLSELFLIVVYILWLNSEN